MNNSILSGELLEALHSPSLLIDRQGTIIGVNILANELFGYSPGELVGQKLEVLIPPSIRELHIGLRDSYLREEPTKRAMGSGLDLSAVRRDGVEVPVEIGLSLLGDLGILTTVRDVSATRHLTRQISLAREEIQSQKNLLIELSHEVRTPLSAAVGLMEHLAGRLDEIEERELLEDIKLNCEHVASLLDAVLEQAKTDFGHAKITKCPFSPRQLLCDIHSLTRLRAALRKVKLTFEEEDLPEMAMSDPLKIRQVLLNLLGNALKFTPEGGSITVRTKYSHKDQNLLLEVSDTGQGMSTEEQSELFSPYRQGEAGRRSQSGTGLGLVLSRTFLELLDGGIEVQSRLGEGTCFSLWIKAEPANSEISISPDSGDAIVHKILIVEDNQICGRSLQLVLEGEGHKVHLCSSAREALAWEKKPDVLILDRNLPDGHGCQLLKELREKYQEELLAIAISGMTDSEHSLNSGFQHHFTKPPDFAELKRILRAHRRDSVEHHTSKAFSESLPTRPTLGLCAQRET